MRKALKYLGTVAGVLGPFVLYFFLKYPEVNKPSDLKVEATPDGLARGRYLADHVAVCIDCHSERNTALWSAPIVPGTEGRISIG